MAAGSTSFIHSLSIQKRVLGALILREIITRYGRHNIGFLWLFLEPMLFTLGVTALWTIVKVSHGSGIPIAGFALTGYSSILLWRNCTGRVVKAIEVNHSLMYHRNVRVIDIFSSRIILEIAGATASLVTLSLLFSFFNLINLPVDILTLISGWILLAWFSFALSLVVGCLSEFTEIIERIWHVLTYLMFPLSGAAFMVDWLPKSFQNFVLWIPMLHCTEMIRHGYFGGIVKTYENPLYVILINIILTLIGFALVKEVGNKVEPE